MTLLPPPRSTLFPYTTLFRSGGLLRPIPVARKNVGPAHNDFITLPQFHLDATDRRTRAARFNMPDRKSTRLNSSHANISYAVFCLKNKTSSQPGPAARTASPL